MEKIYIGLILALIPVLSWSLQYYLAQKQGILKLFKGHPSVYYLDFIFILFNFSFVFCFVFNKIIFFSSILGAIIGTIFIHLLWIKVHLNKKLPFYMFDIKTRRFTYAGIWHFFYCIFELTLVFLFLLSSLSNLFAYICLFLIFIFFIGTIPSSKYIHGKVSMTDIPFFIIGLVIILIKFYFLLIL